MKVAQLLGLQGPWVAPSVQGHGLSPPQELGLYQGLFFGGGGALVAGDQKPSLASFSLYSTHSGT